MTKSQPTRVRRWCFTINNYTADDITQLKNLQKINFLIAGREIGKENKTPHIQGYVEFKESKTLTQVRKHIKGHLTQAQGNKAHNITYCSKEDKDPIIIGNSKTSQGKRTDLNRIQDLIKTQTVKELIADGVINNIQQRKFAEACKADDIQQRTDYPEVIWICGDTGTGKTLQAFQDNQEKTIHKQTQSNKWWNGYEGQDVVILDDIRADFAKYHELLTLLDKYPHKVEIKGGYMEFNSPRIYITSPYLPAEMYKGKEDITQLMRRIDTILHYDDGNIWEMQPRKEFEDNKQEKQYKKHLVSIQQHKDIQENKHYQEEHDEYYSNYT
jgi:hypothetical protein